MTTPAWVQDAIFYQIFPDRFFNGDPSLDPPNVQPWDSKPNRWDYLGGDLRGIIQKLDYLLDLGVNAIYLNPIYHSTANHRYHIIDYFRIDPILGDLDVFHELLAAVHAKGMHLILDGVLNHCGRGFFAFDHVLENSFRSPYKDWFFVHNFPLRAYQSGKAREYEAWWDIKSLPKFNTYNPEVRKYLFGMTRYWMEQGIDGWRLDVPEEIKDEGFWDEYCRLVRDINPDAYMVGEIWTLASGWLNEKRFHGQMNYPLRDALTSQLQEWPPNGALEAYLRISQDMFALENRLAMYNTLGSHDTRRLFTLLRGHMAKTKLVYAFVFASPGAPAIYYGDEIGLRGGKDPANRAAFPWDPSDWNQELRQWVKHLIGMRHAQAALRRGSIELLPGDHDAGVIAFQRQVEDDRILAVFNFSDSPQTWRPGSDELAGTWKDVLNDEAISSGGGRLEVSLPAFGACWLMKA